MQWISPVLDLIWKKDIKIPHFSIDEQLASAVDVKTLTAHPKHSDNPCLESFEPQFLAMPLLKNKTSQTSILDHPNKGDVNENSLRMVEYHVHVQISVSCRYSKTTLYMVFENPTDRLLEGELIIPLPDGATVTGFGLDVDGILVDAVPVEKEKARVIFEEEVRKGADPGLLEHVAGNVFKTRVYPMPVMGKRYIKVIYVNELESFQSKVDDHEVDFLYWFPFEKNRDELQVFSFSVDIIGAKMPNEITIPSCHLIGQSHEIVHLCNLKKQKDGIYRTAFSSKTISMKNDPLSRARGFVFIIPSRVEKQDIDLIASVEKDPQGRYFFTCQDYISQNELKTPPPPQSSFHSNKTPLPQSTFHSNIGIIWDSSLSREKLDKSSEFKIIEGVLNQRIGSNVYISLMRYRMEDPKIFEVKDDKSIQEILQYLSSIVYDGGTSLSSVPIFFEKSSKVAFDFCLLFSDGFSNIGPSMIDTKGLKSPIYTFGSSVELNSAVLKYVSQKSGGHYFNGQNLENILSSIGKPLISFLYAEASDDDLLVDILPSHPTPLPVDGRITIVGRINPDAKFKHSHVTLHYGYGNQVTIKHVVKINPNMNQKSNIFNIFWASQMVEELKAFPDLNKDELQQIGREYGIVTPGCSLMVLESLDQHIKHRIEPAESRTVMRKQYFDTIKTMEQEEEKKIHSKLDSVYTKWSQRVSWFKTDFSHQIEEWKKKNGKKEKEGSNTINNIGSIQRQVDQVRQTMLENIDRVMDRGQSLERLETQSDQLRATNSAFSDIMSLIQETQDLGSSMNNILQEQSLMIQSVSTQMPQQQSNPKQGNGITPISDVSKVNVKKWDPSTPYISKMENVQEDQRYQIYLQYRKENYDSPAFYFDCADYFFKKGMKDVALRIVTNIAELQLENDQLLRIMAYKLHVEGELDMAIHAFERVLKLRPEEPQSYRDLAIVLDEKKEYQRAMELLWKVVTMPVDLRFDEIELTALIELNRIIGIINNSKEYSHLKSVIPVKDSRFIQQMDFDIRISLAWDTDSVDIDLHVLDPLKENAYYGNRNTVIGGHVSRDFTQGYGPEEYMIRRAIPGKYIAKTQYFANHQQKLTGATTLLLTFFTNYARPNEKKQLLSVRLNNKKEIFTVAEIEWKQ